MKPKLSFIANGSRLMKALGNIQNTRTNSPLYFSEQFQESHADVTMPENI